MKTLMPQLEDTFFTGLAKGARCATLALAATAVCLFAAGEAMALEASHPSFGLGACCGVTSSYGSYNSDHTSFTGPVPQVYQLPSPSSDLQTLSPQWYNSNGINPATRQFNTSPNSGNPGMSSAPSFGSGSGAHHDQ